MRTPIIAALALAMSAAAASAQWSGADMNRTIDAVNVLVNSGCSGTVIDAKAGLILTAEHCVADQYETYTREKISDDGTVTQEKVRRLKDGEVSQLTFRGSEAVQTTTYKVRVVATDKSNDLALLKTVAPLPQNEAGRMACTSPVRGDPVYIVGNPFGVLYSSVVSGIVSSVQRDYQMIGIDGPSGQAPLVQISGGIIGGNSGGSVWNASGEFVGVPVRANRINEVIGIAVPLDVIRKFLVGQNVGYLFDHCG